MKTYKTWEMIKEITENPKKEFENKQGHKVTTDGDGWIILIGLDSRKEYKPTGLFRKNINHNWEEVRKPVAFIEAWEHMKKGK